MEKVLEEKIKHLPPTQYNIVNYLSKQGPKVRRELEDDLNIPHTTAYDNLKKLEAKKIVWRTSIQNGKRGRPLVNWQIKQTHILVLFKAQNLVLFDKQAHDLVLSVLVDKPEKKKTILKSSKLPALEREVILDGVKHLTYILKKLENSKPTKQREPSSNKPTNSYILTNRNSKLTKFVLDKISECTYFRTTTLRKSYNDMHGEIKQSVSNRIGRIVRELNDLEIIVKHSESIRSAWKNLYKDNLYDILDKKIKSNKRPFLS